MSLPILRTTELACVACAYSASLSASLGLSIDNGIYAGIDNTDKAAPAVICYSDSATEDFPFSAIHHVRTHVMVKQIAADTLTTSGISDTIFSAFMQDSGSRATKTILNNYPGFYCYEYFITDTSDNVDGDAWVQEYVFDIISALK
jgi:hypothetical protein